MREKRSEDHLKNFSNIQLEESLPVTPFVTRLQFTALGWTALSNSRKKMPSDRLLSWRVLKGKACNIQGKHVFLASLYNPVLDLASKLSVLCCNYNSLGCLWHNLVKARCQFRTLKIETVAWTKVTCRVHAAIRKMDPYSIQDFLN